ncbi:helix-turn-helix domain-containing protein [Comamonas kerstersii]|uniref:Helix-turn-helix domain-containing protein n=1 Tax=Comamonas kerstersii TaxID=225992 RepID=A0A6A1R066_9BURK|nr:helix-turn-helix domain-containing protein [Comamonas kerstersii]KAB0585615.1 helix-turn-helix domain-containing protein [Comamonas kerstersii]
MNEVVVESANQQNSSDDAVMQPSSGQLLRQAREQQQMTVQTLAAMLKVPVHKLQALEEGRWDALTDAVFTRSLALSVCRILNIPSEPVLAGLPKLEGSKLSANPEGINAPFKDKTLRSLMSPSHDSSSGSAFKIVAALLIAVAGSAGLYFLPQWQSEEQETVEAAPASVEPELMFAPQAPGVVVSVQETTVAEQPAAAAQEPAPAPAETEAAAAAVPSADAAQPAEAQAGAGPRLRFAASGDSWVQVRDAQDKVVMEKMMKEGDVLDQAAPSRPLKVVVGNAGATTLEVDGAALNLQESARNNVARFEVK